MVYRYMNQLHQLHILNCMQIVQYQCKHYIGIKLGTSICYKGFDPWANTFMSSKQGGSGAPAWVTEVNCSLAEKGPVINNKDRGGGGLQNGRGGGQVKFYHYKNGGGGRVRIVLAMLKGSGGEQCFGVVLTHELEV